MVKIATIKLYSVYVIEQGNLFSETTYLYRTITIKQGVNKTDSKITNCTADIRECKKKKEKNSTSERDKKSMRKL